MGDAIAFVIGGGLLIAAIWLAAKRWPGERFSAAGLRPHHRVALIVLAMGGLLGTPFWWLDLPPSFAWDLPPLASRLLAAAAFAFGLVGVMVLERPSQARARLMFAAASIYLVPLALAILLLHLDRFDPARPVTYGFFGLVVPLASACVVGWMQLSGRQAEASTPPAGAVRWWMLAMVVVFGLWGALLFLAPSVAIPAVFLWAADPLTSRLIASMLLTIATVSFMAGRDARLAAPALLFAGIYGAGVVAAALMQAVNAKPVPLFYALVLGSAGAVSLILLLLRKRALPLRTA